MRPVAVLLWLVGGLLALGRGLLWVGRGLLWAAEACSGVEARFCAVEGETMVGLVGDVFVGNFYAGPTVSRVRIH